MTNKQQFEVLWKVGCKEGILEIIRNKGRVLSRTQLTHQLNAALRNGWVGRAFSLADLLGTPLNSSQTERLINRCLELRWIPEALQAANQGRGNLSGSARKRLMGAAIRMKLANTSQEAVKLFCFE